MQLIYRFFGVLSLLIGLLAAGCSAQADSTSTNTDAAGGPKLFAVDCTLNPNPATILQENAFSITVKDAQQQKITHATVTFTLSMPEMDHGDITVDAKETEDGLYSAQIVPTMVGKWIVSIHIVANGQTDQLQFPLDAKP